MAKKIVLVKRIASSSMPARQLPRPLASQVRYMAEKSMQELEARAERRKAGMLLPGDEVEEIIEWI